MRAGLTGVSVGLAALAAVRSATASCVGPSGRVLWTYPADGAVDVPTNTQLLVTGDSPGSPSLNGVQLMPRQDGTFDLGELTPHTTYRVTWSAIRTADAGQAISFTTGAGPSLESAPAAPEPLDVRRNPSDYRHCPLVGYQGCFDTGAPQRVSFAPVGDALAWLVESPTCDGRRRMVWPAECGPPMLEGYDARICVSLRATDGVHTSESTQVICSTPAPSANGSVPATSSSCIGIDFPPTGALLLPSKDDVPCSSDGTSTCVAPPPSPPAASPLPVSEPMAMAVPTTEIVQKPQSAGGCSLDPGGHRAGAGWLALALAGFARVWRRRPPSRSC